MMNEASTTAQINNYLRSQQLLQRQLQLLQRIKKADHSRQEASAFNNQVINISNVNHSNQLTHGVNQYATV